jgi:Uncharacterized FAD-dependent dehydrogenases
MTRKRLFLIRDISIPVSNQRTVDYDQEAIQIASRIFNKCQLFSQEESIDFHIYKKSTDARKKDFISFIYTISATFAQDAKANTMPFQEAEEFCTAYGFGILEKDDLTLPQGTEQFDGQPIVAGFGPSGMFCAYILAMAGFRPIVLERGKDIDSRKKAVTDYWNGGILDENTNVQFGEGGAGTFSDGKLLTRINNSLCSFVLQTLQENGAEAEILYQAKPHVGTDKLQGIVKNIRKKILSLGGEIHFESTLTDLVYSSDGTVVSAEINGKNHLSCNALFLALGHSARDSFYMLEKREVSLCAKPFSVGVRIEHLQNDIDSALYGDFAGNPALSHAEYSLSRRYGERGVYSFCMCPGGTVVASASAQNEIVTNGMSNSYRDGINANSAIAVSVLPRDFGTDYKSAIEYQSTIERNAFLAGNGCAPIQTVGDFLSGKVTTEPSRILPSYTGKTALCDLSALFPQEIAINLKRGLVAFEGNIKNFSVSDAVLTAPETRTSSPVRILRTDRFTACGHENLYPCGEGAGYAGGITSAAVDGIKAALSFLERYKR